MIDIIMQLEQAIEELPKDEAELKSLLISALSHIGDLEHEIMNLRENVESMERDAAGEDV